MIELRDVSVCFKQKEKEIQAVDSVDLTIEKGDVYGIVGYSGAGKSTLVRVMNLLQKPTAGEVIVNQTNLSQLSPKELRKERKAIGMIFQHFNLMESRTIFDNVDFSLKYSGKSKQERRQKVNELLELVGLEEKASAYPKQLSGGQKQRVAIARALANEPKVLLCDEATSALDPKTTLQILALLKKLNRQLGLTIVLIIAHSAFADQIANKWLVELSYIGNQTNEPLIAHLYSKYQVTANILYGNVELLQETPLGSLIVTLAGETKQRKKALDYLIKSGVKINILQKNELDSRIKVIEGGR